jgi:WD40 repeat protein
VDSISGGELRIWDLETGKLERELRPEGANPPDVLHATFSADGSSVLVATRSTTVKAYRVADGKVARSFAGPSVNGAGSVTAAYVPGDREIAALWEDGKVYFWDARMGRRTRGIAFKDGERPIESMDISDDGRFLAGVGEGVLGLWDLATGAELWRLDDPGLRVADAAFAPGGARILAGCEDGSLLILGSADGTRLARLGAGD